MGTDLSYRDYIPLMDVLGTCQDLNRIPFSEVHLANPKMIGIRMTLNGHDFARNDAFDAFTQVKDLLHFEPDAGKFISKSFRRNRNLYIFFSQLIDANITSGPLI